MDDTAATPATNATATASAAAVAADGALKKTGVASASSTSIKLLIKSSNQQYEDQIIESDLLWTVRRLKTHLSFVYPSKPPVGEQKLIYSGQLLTDTLQLKDVIRSYKDVYTQNHIIHLVYIPKNTTTNLPKQNTSAKITNTSNMNGARSAAATNDGLRQRHVSSPTTANVVTSNVTTAGVATPNVTNGQQQSVRQMVPGMQQYQQPSLLQMQQQQQQAAQYAAQFGLNPNQMSMMANSNFLQQMQYIQNAQANCVPPAAANAWAAQQQAIYNAWLQQVYTYYMEQMMRLSSAGQNTNPNVSQFYVNPQNFLLNPQSPDAMALPQMFYRPFHDFATNQVAGGVATTTTTPAAANSLHQSPQPPVVDRNDHIIAAAAVAQQAREAQVQAQAQRQQQLQEQAAAIEARRFQNVAQDDQENRDWLDSFLSITRLAILLTISYFNTSPLRCLIVLVIGAVIYLYHIGVLRGRQERNNNNINRNNNAQPGIEQAAIRQGVQEVQAAAEQQQQQGQQQQEQQQQQQQNNNDPPNDDEIDAMVRLFDSNIAMFLGDADNENNDDGNNANANVHASTAAAAENPNPNATAAAIENLSASTNEPAVQVDELVEDEDNASVISIVRTFVVTFFTSLLPETPAL